MQGCGVLSLGLTDLEFRHVSTKGRGKQALGHESRKG